MYCKICGAVLADDAVFCYKCGTGTGNVSGTGSAGTQHMQYQSQGSMGGNGSYQSQGPAGGNGNYQNQGSMGGNSYYQNHGPAGGNGYYQGQGPMSGNGYGQPHPNTQQPHGKGKLIALIAAGVLAAILLISGICVAIGGRSNKDAETSGQSVSNTYEANTGAVKEVNEAVSAGDNEA